MNFKYEQNQTVWVIAQNKLKETRIRHRIISDNSDGFTTSFKMFRGISYETNAGYFTENQLFETKEELIKDLSK